MSLSILLWRGWQPAFRNGITYSTVAEAGIGGTELQMLWHAGHLAALGHQVQLIGTVPKTVHERGVEFIGATSRDEQVAAINSGVVRTPDVIFLEGGYHAARFFRETYPKARIVHVGQNIDVGADRAAFAQWKWIDAYAFVGLGHLADYSSRFPRRRGKFVLIRNAVPWSEFHSRVLARPVEDKVVWVGSWNKKGLRTWCGVIHDVFRQRPGTRWTLCGPQYGTSKHPLPLHLTAGLNLPRERTTVCCLPLVPLLEEISSARAVVVSLGNECGPGSVLDAHAMARPVISGNDMVYAFSNPYGTGLRVTHRHEAYTALNFLLDHHDEGDAIGKAGRDLMRNEYHENHQREDIRRVLDFLLLGDKARKLSQLPGTSHGEQVRQDFLDKVTRKVRTLRSRYL